MDKFVRRQNVARYERLANTVTDPAQHMTIMNLLAEERQKQAEASDTNWGFDPSHWWT